MEAIKGGARTLYVSAPRVSSRQVEINLPPGAHPSLQPLCVKFCLLLEACGPQHGALPSGYRLCSACILC